MVGTLRQTFRSPYRPCWSVDTGKRRFVSSAMACTIAAIVTATAQPAPPLRRDDFRSAAAGSLRHSLLEFRRETRDLLQRTPATVAEDQIGTIESPCSPSTSAFTCVGANFSSSAMSEPRRAVSIIVPRPITCFQGSRGRRCEIRQNVDRVRHDDHDCVWRKPAAFIATMIWENSATLRSVNCSGIRRVCAAAPR